MSKLHKLVAEIIAELLKEEPELLVRRKLSYDEPSIGRPEDHISKEAQTDIEEDLIQRKKELTPYQKFFNKTLDTYGVDSPDQLTPKKKAEFFNYVDTNWKSDEEEVGIEESSTTGGVDGYETPFAFSKPGTDPKKKKAVTAMNWPVVESIDFKDINELTPKRKIANSIKTVREQLNLIERFIDNSIDIKEQNKLGSSDLYIRTKKALNKISEQMTRIMNKLQQVK